MKNKNQHKNQSIIKKINKISYDITILVSHIYIHCLWVWFVWVSENIPLNQSCDFNEQCTGSRYATCLDGACTCTEGYIATNSSECVVGMKMLHFFL